MPGKKKISKKESKLLDLLRSSLSEEEIRQVFAGALLSLDKKGFDRLIQHLHLDTGKTLRQVMASYKKGVSKSKPTPGLGKIRQEWDRAISDWWDCLMESGDEEGKYVYQENHWDAPYLDTSALAEDLKKIAARMRSMIHRVVKENVDSEFDFFELAEKSVEEVGSGLPEWMECWDDGYLFGAEVTGCLLEWAWLKARTNQITEASFEFIEDVRELESSNDKIYLDEDAVVGFVLALDEDCQRDILAGIEENRTAPEWKAVLGNVRSGWFMLHKELLKRWSKSRHSEICRENIQKDWKLALPVLEGLIKKGAFEEASAIAEEARKGLLDDELWEPTRDLLICHRQHYFFYSSEETLVRFFNLWSKTAGGLGRKELQAALSLQAVMVAKWKDWDTVLSKFDKSSSAGFEALVDRFYEQWKNLTAEQAEKYTVDKDWGIEGSWIPILIDEARAKRRNSRRFHKSMREWLKQASHPSENMKHLRYYLEKLTWELNRSSAIRKISPALYQILSSRYSESDLLDKSMKRWLKRLDGSALFSDIMAVWKKGIVHLVPDPAGARNSRYDHHAEWLKALFELNHPEYDRMVKEWREIHRRRINLWKAVSKQGLPVPGKR
ncbi:MAG: hypothetical protein QNJ97_07415 [Myxococcota bacterium]|nr:hypothetical protein [Myxococcota bacterium]